MPAPTPESQPYWDGLKAGHLLLQKCGQCGKVRHYPRPLCDVCFSFDVEWIEASRGGSVHTWTITHHAFNAAFKPDLPLVLVTVDLDEGVRIQAPLRRVSHADISVGLRVQVVFEDGAPPFATLACVIAG